MKTEDYSKQVTEIRRDYALKSAENRENSQREIDHIKKLSDASNKKLADNSERNRRELEKDYIVTLDRVRSDAEQLSLIHI